jgi:hypothetical protein
MLLTPYQISRIYKKPFSRYLTVAILCSDPVYTRICGVLRHLTVSAFVVYRAVGREIFILHRIVQFLPFWGDVAISFVPFSLLKRQKQKKKKQKKRHVYLLLATLWLFYALVNLTIFNFFHLLHWLQT